MSLLELLSVGSVGARRELSSYQLGHAPLCTVTHKAPSGFRVSFLNKDGGGAGGNCMEGSEPEGEKSMQF